MCKVQTRFAAANYKRLMPFLDAVERTPEKYFRFTSDPYMPLSIENLCYSFNGCPVYSMMHFCTHHGDLMRDPDMTFYVDRQNGNVIPMTYQQDNAGLYQEVFNSDGTYCKHLLCELDQFLNFWSKNILAQGFKSSQAGGEQSGNMSLDEFAASVEA